MELQSGKYKLYIDDQTLCIKRYGQSWREVVEDKAIRALFDYALKLEVENRELRDEIFELRDEIKRMSTQWYQRQ